MGTRLFEARVKHGFQRINSLFDRPAVPHSRQAYFSNEFELFGDDDDWVEAEKPELPAQPAADELAGAPTALALDGDALEVAPAEEGDEGSALAL